MVVVVVVLVVLLFLLLLLVLVPPSPALRACAWPDSRGPHHSNIPPPHHPLAQEEEPAGWVYCSRPVRSAACRPELASSNRGGWPGPADPQRQTPRPNETTTSSSERDRKQVIFANFQ